VISAGTLIAVAPLLVAFLLIQWRFMQSFMQAGIKRIAVGSCTRSIGQYVRFRPEADIAGGKL
jgi:hypothetical protein